MANIEAGNDEQIIIRDLVESFGLTIGSQKTHGVICAIATVESIYKDYGYHVLSRVLRLIIGAWEGDCNSFSGSIMKAVAKLVVVYKNVLDDEIFKEKLGAVSLKTLARTAKERRPGMMGYAEAMVIEYNGKKKNNVHRLRIGKLYEKEGIDDEYEEPITFDLPTDDDK